jgi:dihydrofolate reductase
VKLTVTTFLTLDGVMQGPGQRGEDGFDLGGWLVPYADDDMMRFVHEWFAEADAFLLGRRTYEIFASWWPKVTDENDPIAAALNRLPKYVASRTLKNLEWNNSRLIKGDVAAEVRKLKQQTGRELQVHGSGNLVQTLMEHELIDEYRLWFYPVILGRGKRLFREGSALTALRLVDSKTTSSGVVIHVYHPAGRPTYGSFALEEAEGTIRARAQVPASSGGKVE